MSSDDVGGRETERFNTERLGFFLNVMLRHGQVTMWELLSRGSEPYDYTKKDAWLAKDQIKRGELLLADLKEYARDPVCVELMRDCVQHDPLKRPDAKKVLTRIRSYGFVDLKKEQGEGDARRFDKVIEFNDVNADAAYEEGKLVNASLCNINIHASKFHMYRSNSDVKRDPTKGSHELVPPEDLPVEPSSRLQASSLYSRPTSDPDETTPTFGRRSPRLPAHPKGLPAAPSCLAVQFDSTIDHPDRQQNSLQGTARGSTTSRLGGEISPGFRKERLVRPVEISTPSKLGRPQLHTAGLSHAQVQVDPYSSHTDQNEDSAISLVNAQRVDRT
eukprot:1052849-Amorphochlora_amoeboformis.AAC.1